MALGILLLVGSISDDDRNSPQFGGPKLTVDRTIFEMRLRL